MFVFLMLIFSYGTILSTHYLKIHILNIIPITSIFMPSTPFGLMLATHRPAPA